jgi:hypothetical protein
VVQQPVGVTSNLIKEKKKIKFERRQTMLNDITIESWYEENEDRIWTEYYESGACYDTSLETFIERAFERELEGTQ